MIHYGSNFAAKNLKIPVMKTMRFNDGNQEEGDMFNNIESLKEKFIKFVF